MEYLRQFSLELEDGFTGIILAGGMSRRMGRDKANLKLLGKTLLQWQVDKLRSLGANEIIISGCEALPGTKAVRDIYPERGPLGGLHACLSAAAHSRCLVLGVDIPLVPVQTLQELLEAHSGGVTVLRHTGGQEPLIGIYDSALSEVIGPMIRERGVSVRSLASTAAWKCFDYEGPSEYLTNCNTPEEFERVTHTAEHLFAAGLLP